MEERKRKFVCKYCLKRFPCGKSLGGHIRTHMTEERIHAAAIASASASAVDNNNNIHIFNRDLEPVAAVTDNNGGNGNPTYGLRENPKKTIRFVHSHHHHHHAAAAAAATTALEHEMIKFCKECGKGFPSLKALCGHMASHSEKEKKIINKFDDQMEEDTQSDDTHDDDDTCVVAASTMNLRKSKRRIRFKSLTLTNQPSSSSVSVSEMEQEQQEEVARCLILLSRDFYSHKGPFVSEPSDNNSGVLETKSKIVIRNGNQLVSSNARRFVEEKKKKLKSVGGIGISINSDLRDFRYASKKIELVDSTVSKYKIKRPKMEEDKSRFENCRSKYNVATVFKKSRMMNKDLDHDNKFDSRKKAKYEEFDFNNKNEEIYESGRKSLKYEFFRSEKDKGCSYDLITDDESDEEKSSESDSLPAAKFHNSKLVNRNKSSNKGKKKKKKKKMKKKLKSNKSKEYECPICYKIFTSGQALGGHKRSHFVGGSEENTFVIKQNVAPCLIDLNLPAPLDE